ncbi:MAG: hypothetical protein JXQ87_06305 [Bacteroidia bacterium]
MKTNQEKDLVNPEVNSRKRKYVFKLVDGDYSIGQTNNILFDLINSKINFHNTEIFKNQEKYGENSPHSEKRIAELKAVMETLTKVLEIADDKGKNLRVKSTIEIEYINK